MLDFFSDAGMLLLVMAAAAIFAAMAWIGSHTN